MKIYFYFCKLAPYFIMNHPDFHINIFSHLVTHADYLFVKTPWNKSLFTHGTFIPTHTHWTGSHCDLNASTSNHSISRTLYTQWKAFSENRACPWMQKGRIDFRPAASSGGCTCSENLTQIQLGPLPELFDPTSCFHRSCSDIDRLLLLHLASTRTM